jgi:hypothetical protein
MKRSDYESRLIGNFKGEPAFTPYFYDRANGKLDEDSGYVEFVVDHEDHAIFPELPVGWHVRLQRFGPAVIAMWGPPKGSE